MQHLLGDERAYDAMARGFASGDLGRERAFYQEPLYAWVVSLVYRAVPPEVPAIHTRSLLSTVIP